MLRQLLVPGAVFQSIVVGGGYGTGREIVQYQTLPGEAERYLIAIRNLSPGVAVDWQLRASIRRSQQ